ncbi:hypothetical protein V1505DRAFT_396548 [Lipomyces doorenjongii]
MDAQDAFYIALVLDPRFKARLLEKELGAETADNIVNILKDALHSDYPLSAQTLSTSGEPAVVGNSIAARVLQKVQPHTGNWSDIEHYFNSAAVVVNFPRDFRLLRPGGRVAISDILAKNELPSEVREDLFLYVECIAGAS